MYKFASNTRSTPNHLSFGVDQPGSHDRLARCLTSSSVEVTEKDPIENPDDRRQAEESGAPEKQDLDDENRGVVDEESRAARVPQVARSCGMPSDDDSAGTSGVDNDGS